MTNQQSQGGDNSQESKNLRQKIWGVITKPRNQIIALVSLGSIVLGGYIGGKILITRVIPPRIEAELEKILARDVELGKIEIDSFHRVIVDDIVIPATEEDSSNITIETVTIDANIWSLFGEKKLYLDVVARDIKGYAQLDTLIPPSEEEKPLPSTLRLPPLPVIADITLELENADLAVTPNGDIKSIDISSEGKIELLYDEDKQPLRYNLTNKIAENNTIRIQGKTSLGNTNTQATVKIDNLNLPEFTHLIPQLPLEVSEGIVTGKIIADIPSLPEIENTTTDGYLFVDKVTGKVDSQKIQLPADFPSVALLNQEFNGNLEVNLKQQSVIINQGNFNWGEIEANARGKIDLQEGYNLQGNLVSLNIAQILPDIGVTLPVKVNGLVDSKINVRGEIDNPQITGNLNIAQTIIDKVDLGKIESEFTVNLDEIKIAQVKIQPTFGGDITSEGLVKINLRETILARKPFQLQKTDFNFKFLADLPPNPLITTLNLPDYGVNFNNLVAVGEIKGNLEKPQGVVSFALPRIEGNNLTDVETKGKLVINEEKITLVDTQLIANNNSIDIIGDGEFSSGDWQLNIAGNQFNLTPFIQQFCQNNFVCNSVNTNLPIILTRLDGNLQGNLNSLVLEDIKGDGNLAIRVDNGNLDLDTTLINGDLLVDGDANNIALQKIIPTLNTSINLVNSEINLETGVEDLLTIATSNNLPDGFYLSATSQLDVDRGMIDAVATVTSENVNVIADVSQIPLQEIIPTLPAEVTSSEIRLNADTKELYGLATRRVNYDNLLNLDSLNVTANVDGKIANGKINSTARVSNGRFNVQGFTSNVSPALLIPQVNLPADNLNADFTANGNVTDLINFALSYLETKTFSTLPSLQANVVGNADVGEKGEVDFTARLNNNQWQTKIDSNNLDLQYIADSLNLIDEKFPLNLASLPQLNTQVNLDGNLDNLFSDDASLPIQIKPTEIKLGENIVRVKGDFDVVNLFTQPDVNNLKLDIATDSQLNTIAVREIVTSLSDTGINLLPSQINLEGKAKLTGVVTGNNLLTNPLGENGITLLADVSLTDFKLDQVEFEPSLKGKLIVNPQSRVSLNLQGSQDVIALVAVKDDLEIKPLQTTIPYTPQSLEIRQGGEEGLRILGNLEEGEFVASINNLVLENLQLQPAINYGIDGRVEGKLSTEVAVNLNDLTAKGNINLINPGLDFIEAKEINSSFAYANNIATLDEGVLKFGDTVYNLAGRYNIATQDIQGKIDLKGDVEDIFTTLKITDIETLTAFAQQLQTRDYFAQAKEIATQSIGNVEEETIATQVNLLASIDQQIKSIAKQIREGKLPNDLDIIGDYQGEILIGGKLTNPVINLDLQGEKWQWLPQQDFPNIVDSLGFVMEQTEAIAIPELNINAEYRNNNLAVKPLLVNIGGSEISFVGDISAQSQNGEFKVNQFPLDLATRFFPLPIDLETTIDLEGKISGRFINPEIEGVLTLNDTAIDSAIIEEKIITNFTYNNYELKAQTTTPDYISLTAKIPYHPIIAVNQPASVNIELDERSKDTIGIITEGRLNIASGEYQGKLNVTVNSVNKLINNFDLEDIKVTGNLNFQDTEVTSTLIKNSVLLSGDINLAENQIVNVDNLIANINNSNVNIKGSLPILTPISILPENILTVNIPQQGINLEGLYSGELDANIPISGTVLRPQIGGYLALKNGNFELPSRQAIADTKNQFLWNEWLGDSLNTTINNLIDPNLNDFTLTLENSQLAQWGLYRFLFDGKMTVSGPVLEFDRLRANGAVNLRRGQIYISSATPIGDLAVGFAGSQTVFYLSRTNENKITFNPNDNILNPQLDIQVKADIVDYSRELPSTQRNEINDPIIRGGRGDNVQVVLDIDGGLAQLLPVLSGTATTSCNFPVSDTIPQIDTVVQEKLEPIADCVNLAILNPDLSGVSLLNSPLVSLSSTPNRNEGELINLIVGGQLLNLASQLQNLSSEDLLENGLIQFILVPIANNLSFGINERVSTWGKPLGMDDLRIFPLVEGVYKVGENANVSISYDYIYSESKVQYQIRF